MWRYMVAAGGITCGWRFYWCCIFSGILDKCVFIKAVFLKVFFGSFYLVIIQQSFDFVDTDYLWSAVNICLFFYFKSKNMFTNQKHLLKDAMGLKGLSWKLNFSKCHWNSEIEFRFSCWGNPFYLCFKLSISKKHVGWVKMKSSIFLLHKTHISREMTPRNVWFLFQSIVPKCDKPSLESDVKELLTVEVSKCI